MARLTLAAMFLIVAAFGMAQAQEGSGQARVWVQIEAKPNLTAINEALRRRAASLSDVNGFALRRSGWYAVALGPYDTRTAERVLSDLRAQRRIPRDSYIARNADYARQIWPVGANLLDRGAPAAPGEAPGASEPGGGGLAAALARAAETPAPPKPADETRREARANEARLTSDARAELQVALKWAGQYRGRIDAQFGPGTRNAMAAWQAANGHEPTGVLTTAQRAELLRNYNAVLDGMGLAPVTDRKAGIRMQLPLGVVKFARYEPPFVHFKATGDLPARVLMISQEGTQDTLFGLYDIMQTLRIVPENGPRERGRDSFTLVGENARIVSHTEARLENGRIKGLTLVWPAGDEARRTRVLGIMQESFTRIDGVLDPGAGERGEQRVDLVSGLEIRKPKFTRSGFYVDGRGTVVTTGELAEGCGRITIDDGQEVDVAASSGDPGIAVLRPRGSLAPMGVAKLLDRAPRINSDVTLAGYSHGGVLGAPTLTHGTLSDIRGLNGEEGISRLSLDPLDGDAGGPVMDASGAVLGMLLPRAAGGGRTLPDGVAFAADARALARMLKDAGAAPATTRAGGKALTPAGMSRRAAGMTVLVNCWE